MSMHLLLHAGDLLDVDLRRATVIYLYLLPEGIAALRPKLECVYA